MAVKIYERKSSPIYLSWFYFGWWSSAVCESFSKGTAETTRWCVLNSNKGSLKQLFLHNTVFKSLQSRFFQEANHRKRKTLCLDCVLVRLLRSCVRYDLCISLFKSYFAQRYRFLLGLIGWSKTFFFGFFKKCVTGKAFAPIWILPGVLGLTFLPCQVHRGKLKPFYFMTLRFQHLSQFAHRSRIFWFNATHYWLVRQRILSHRD